MEKKGVPEGTLLLKRGAVYWARPDSHHQGLVLNCASGRCRHQFTSFFELTSPYVPVANPLAVVPRRQEPGRNLLISVPALSVMSGPQSQAAMAEPAEMFVVRPASAHGNRMMPLPLVVVLMPVTMTWMAPWGELVAIDLTYLETLTPVVDSQPQLPAAGSPAADCVVSGTLVRHARAA